MLTELRISNLGVVASAELKFDHGLNVLTGETGAGKTMILNALTQTLGAKSDPKMVRDGTDKCVIESDWQLTPNQLKILNQQEVVTDHNLTLGKLTEAAGKSRIILNGLTASQTTVAEISENLIQIFGQSDQQYLAKPSWQLAALDALGGSDHQELIQDYQDKFATYQELKTEITKLYELEKRWETEQQRIENDLIQFDGISPKPNEDDEIIERIRHLESMADTRAELIDLQLLFDDENSGSISNQFRSLIKALNRIDDFQDLAATVAAVPAHLNEIEHKLVELLSQEDSETSLENLYSRKADLQGLIRKHGVSLNELIAKMESERVLVQAGESPSDEIARLVKKLEELEKRIAHIAGQLSNARKELASKLDKLVTAELAGLKMSGSVFRTEISSVKNGISEISGMKLDRSGADSISFGMAHGASGSVRPIAKAASGGELSRIMLALQVVLPSHNPDLTYVFDEVDAGIGGETAIEVGRRLAQLAKSNQVIVVTHLPQVAAFADVHFSVSGDVGAGIKTSDVSALTTIEREVEIARMLGGMRDSKAAITHAKELLELKR